MGTYAYEASLPTYDQPESSGFKANYGRRRGHSLLTFHNPEAKSDWDRPSWRDMKYKHPMDSSSPEPESKRVEEDRKVGSQDKPEHSWANLQSTYSSRLDQYEPCYRCKNRRLRCSTDPTGCARCVELKIECHYSQQKRVSPLDEGPRPTDGPFHRPQAVKGPSKNGQPLSGHSLSDDEVKQELGVENKEVSGTAQNGNLRDAKSPVPISLPSGGLPRHFMFPQRCRPDRRGYSNEDDGFPIAKSDTLHTDRTGQRWRAKWDGDLEWWLWVVDPPPGNDEENQHLKDLECFRKRISDFLGPAAGGPEELGSEGADGEHPRNSRKRVPPSIT